ncbi:hypothetical protein [Kurthia huakuii]|uniref:hypothetical protein n=1 Tax=Kurthia huakuii TaxID=1421019 RepID=UPI000496E607|nr:hypothetical protein [Kurthia huakuii]MBM7698791.1 hypothetical protein [Kurthia huakuii]
MKKLAILIVVVAMIAGIAYMKYSFEKPSVTIKAAQTPVEVTEGTYCWSSLTSSACVDKISPPEIIRAEKIAPTIVKPGATLQYSFNRTPLKDSTALSLWMNEDNEEKNVALNNNTFQAPKESGIYVYNLSANWDRGDVNYVFAIQVE